MFKGSFETVTAEMSKWELLKNSLNGKRTQDRSASIHRFDGFQMLAKRKKLWAGYNFTYALEEIGVRDLKAQCLVFASEFCQPRFELTDCAEIRVVVTSRASKESLESFLSYLCKDDKECCKIDVDLDGSVEEIVEENTHYQEMVVRSMTFEPFMKRSTFWFYSVPRELCKVGEECALLSREKPVGDGVSLNGLLSNRLHGIDNTGNVCVWASESILFYTILENQVMRKSLTSSRVLELGGGMTSLCGMGLAVMADCEEVFLTDGHPDCVRNQRVCLQMTKQSLPEKLHSRIDRVTCAQLRWSESDELGDLAAMLRNQAGNSSPSLFDVVLVADCLFFKDCHDALLSILRQTLSQTGTAYLLQPPRSGTMALFLEKAKACFDTYVHEEYCDKVTTLRATYKAEADSNGYDEDIHYPLLVTLRWPLAQADGK